MFVLDDVVILLLFRPNERVYLLACLLCLFVFGSYEPRGSVEIWSVEISSIEIWSVEISRYAMPSYGLAMLWCVFVVSVFSRVIVP